MPKKTEKKVAFEGSSHEDLRSWPKEVRQVAGYQIHRLQDGLDPTDWAPLKSAGQGVKEIRISESNGWWRVIYVQVVKNTVHVLHCFQKKTNKTAKHDIDIAKQRYKDLTNK